MRSSDASSGSDEKSVAICKADFISWYSLIFEYIGCGMEKGKRENS